MVPWRGVTAKAQACSSQHSHVPEFREERGTAETGEHWWVLTLSCLLSRMFLAVGGDTAEPSQSGCLMQASLSNLG